MPSRRQPSSETTQPQLDSRRSSLRRLSSIASLQTLNPFNRRRSNNATDSPSSNVSLSSTLANAPDQQTDSQVSTESEGQDALPPLPTQPHLSNRRSSYICLPDDPIGGMPRSRTFSNLPLPTRARRTTGSLVQSKSHARLPSTSSKSNLPASRLPTPTASTRKHSGGQPSVSENRTATSKKKLIRSDTEPLIQKALGQDGGTLPLPRSTAFKENISLSPIKPLSRLDDIDFFGDSTRHFSSREGWSDSSESGGLLPEYPPARTSSLAYSARAQHGGATTRRLSQKFESSPAYRSSKERPPTPGKPVQRWSSQPLLTASTNQKAFHGEIKQTRLMSAKQAPTPPPPKTPTAGLLLDVSNGRPRQHSVGQEQGRIDLDEKVRQIRARAESLQQKPGAITRAEPLAYWTGRFSSLNDRYRNEELSSANLPSNKAIPNVGEEKWQSKFETDQMHSTEANSIRMRRAVEHLYSLCASDEATASFLIWQRAAAKSLCMPELGKPVKGSDGRVCALEMSLKEKHLIEDAMGTPPSSERRKTSFMQKLLGKRQKSLGAMSVGTTY